MENMPDALIVEEVIKQLDWSLFKIAMDTKIEAIKRTGTFGNSACYEH